jgi:hypothetical protein
VHGRAGTRSGESTRSGCYDRDRAGDRGARFGAKVPASTATGLFPATFIGISAGFTRWRLAVYSAGNGRVLKYLTAAEPGGGPGLPSLSADGGTVIFQRGQGSCATTIDAVPAGGGPERVLIPLAAAATRPSCQACRPAARMAGTQLPHGPLCRAAG